MTTDSAKKGQCESCGSIVPANDLKIDYLGELSCTECTDGQKEKGDE
jgi:hypothetical protein